jgi:hypothetical protein
MQLRMEGEAKVGRGEWRNGGNRRRKGEGKRERRQEDRKEGRKKRRTVYIYLYVRPKEGSRVYYTRDEGGGEGMDRHSRVDMYYR